ncbi:hypothetical protein Ddc_04866 [Ditylenchus destructor]|nr:hypothetical protein Ddc_04866 [Ditylenchus destructor]
MSPQWAVKPSTISSIYFACLSILFTISLSSCTDPTQYCENYSVCLQKLEAKQRECLKFPEFEPSLTRTTASSNQTECNKKKRRQVSRDLAQLHLRRTEIVRDCVAKNVNRGESILNPNKEKKCLKTADKLSTIAEVMQVTTKKPSRKNGPKGKIGSAVDISRSPKRHSKRKEATKQNAKLCRRAKKTLNRKCHQLSKCCSIAKECVTLAEAIDDQLRSLKAESKSSNCRST